MLPTLPCAPRHAVFTVWTALVLFVAALGAAPASASPDPPARGRPAGASKLFDLGPGRSRTDRIVVKFSEGSGVRLRGGALVSARPGSDPGAFRAWLAAHPGIAVTRHFARDEAALERDRSRGERRGGVRLADLNLYYRLSLPASADPAAARDVALSELRLLPLVELAFAEPFAEPAALETKPHPRGVLGSRLAVEVGAPGPGAAVAVSGSTPAAGAAFSPNAATTPDYTSQQGYLYAPPSGINAQAVWAYPGGRGAGVRIIDIEGAWLWTHEDLPAPFFTGGTPIPDQSWRNHGTAVLGEMVGRLNAFGVTGIASDMQAGAVSIGDLSTAAAIDLASSQLDPGDLFLIELHAPGPNATGTGQFGYVPMEFWQDNFDAIQTAVANGRICIEAAGNGQQNLDDAVYQGLFDRTLRNSGAILVGAGTPAGVAAEWFTNYGSRLDLNGWGSSVVTCGYGSLQGGAETQWYASGFNGTSSASPIVAGAVACLQGMSEAMWGIPLSGPLAAQILYETGTPWSGPNRIGRRPDLVAARALLQQGIGVIAGTVRDGATGDPLAGVDVRLVEPDVLVRTDGSGHYETPLLAGAYTVRASGFFYQTSEQPVSLSAGQTVTHDVSLARKPAGALAGIVLAGDGTPLPGAEVRVIGTPIPADTAGAAGAYSIGGIPEASGYQAVYGLVPGRGAAVKSFDVAAGATTAVNAKLVPAETFESGAAGFTGGAPWERGTPSGVGPPSAFSGSSCWGIDLDAPYGNDVTAYLTSGSYDFAAASQLFLSFTHWYDTEAGFDGGAVQVWSGGSWITVEPAGGYPLDFLGGLANGSGYSGVSGAWQPAVFDLTSFISGDVRVRFWFGSDAGVTGPGWYIDDVAFEARTPAVAAPEAEPGPAALLAAAPNPFSTALTLSFRLPAEGRAALRIFDAAGRLVRVLASGRFSAGVHAVRWDGADAQGRPAPSGVYFGVLEAGGRDAGKRRFLLLR